MSLKPPDKDYINWYKTNISLPDFARDYYGFVSRRDKSSVNYPVLVHPKTDNKFIFKLNSRAQFTFFSPLNDAFKGSTIWDFVRHMESQLNPSRELLTFPQIKSILDSYLNSNSYIRPGESLYLLKNSPKQSVFSPYDLSPLTDLAYLEGRMISKSTINHPYFKGKIFNHNFHDPEKGVSYVNTAFVMTDLDNNICALSLKNKAFHANYDSKYQHIQGSRANGLFLSTNTSKLDYLYLVESGIDALSHFQMNSNEFNGKSVLYGSSEGTLCEGQLIKLQQIIENQKPTQVHFAFDNDIAGNVYSINLIGSLNYSAIIPTDISSNLPKLLVKPIVESEHSQGKIYFQFENNSREEGIERIDWLNKMFTEFNSKFSGSYADCDAYSVSLHQLTDHSCQGLIRFENNKSLWNHMFHFVHHIKFDNSNVFIRDLPFSKDWNDDLQIILNVHPKFRLSQNENKEYMAVPKEDSEVKNDELIQDNKQEDDKQPVKARKTLMKKKGPGKSMDMSL